MFSSLRPQAHAFEAANGMVCLLCVCASFSYISAISFTLFIFRCDVLCCAVMCAMFVFVYIFCKVVMGTFNLEIGNFYYDRTIASRDACEVCVCMCIVFLNIWMCACALVYNRASNQANVRAYFFFALLFSTTTTTSSSSSELLSTSFQLKCLFECS